MGGGSDEFARSAVEASNGGFVATGRTNSYGGGGHDILLAGIAAPGYTCLGDFVTANVTSVYPIVDPITPTVTPHSPVINEPSVTVSSPIPETTTICEGLPFIRGDVDGDGLVSWLDLWYLLCYLFSKDLLPPCWDAADVNDHGVVDASDLMYLISYLGGNGPLPPPPFPEPGFDPTPDSLDCAGEYVTPTPSALDSLIVSSASGSAGQVIAVPIIVRNSQALLSYQIHLEFDPNILQATGVDTTGTATGAVGPVQFGFNTGPRGAIEIWCYIDCQRLRSIPPGRDTLVKIMFQVDESDSCGIILLDLKNVTGPPFTGNLLDYSGGKVYPTLVDSNFTAGHVYPEIISIADVGNDQGKQVRLNWARSCYDASGSPVTITEYSIWRRIGEDKAGGLADKTLLSDIGMSGEDRLYPPGNWDFIKTVPARGEETYNTVCPTLGDSTTAEGMYWSVFFVSAMTANPLVYYDSDPDSGYSLDNISPLPIRDMVVNPNSWFTLTWTVPGEYEGEHPISNYDIRYDTIPVGDNPQAWWDSAHACSGTRFFNYAVGDTDSIQVAKESWNHPHVYFAIKGRDDRPNYSEISNIVRFKCGDASGDGVVDASDLVYLLNYLFASGPPPNPMAVGDVTCDGVVDISDVVYLLNYLFAHGPQPCGSY
jgi:hypothetical protein